MSGPESGRRPELRDEACDDERNESGVRGAPGSGARPEGGRARRTMNAETAGSPVSVEEGRCRVCGEEVRPVPT